MRRPILVSTLLAACAHTASAPRAPAEPATEPTPALVTAAASRELRRDAQFRDLVTLLEQEDALPSNPLPCLLGDTPRGFLFAGEAAVALHPLPPPADELDGSFGAAPGVRVLTRHGSYGPAGATLGLVALSEAPPARRAVALAITDRAIYVRELDRPTDSATPLDALSARLGDLGDALVFVVAEARVPLARVLDVLARVDASNTRVALALALSPDVVLPAAGEPARDVARCPDGLPATDAVSGDLPIEALTSGIAPARERFGECLSRADGPGRAGGRLTLALRIAEDGRVADACVVASEVDDAALHQCITSLARELRFEAPSPRGVVDAELPILLRPEFHTAPRASCGTLP